MDKWFDENNIKKNNADNKQAEKPDDFNKDSSEIESTFSKDRFTEMPKKETPPFQKEEANFGVKNENVDGVKNNDWEASFLDDFLKSAKDTDLAHAPHIPGVRRSSATPAAQKPTNAESRPPAPDGNKANEPSPRPANTQYSPGGMTYSPSDSRPAPAQQPQPRPQNPQASSPPASSPPASSPPASSPPASSPPASSPPAGGQGQPFQPRPMGQQQAGQPTGRQPSQFQVPGQTQGQPQSNFGQSGGAYNPQSGGQQRGFPSQQMGNQPYRPNAYPQPQPSQKRSKKGVVVAIIVTLALLGGSIFPLSILFKNLRAGSSSSEPSSINSVVVPNSDSSSSSPGIQGEGSSPDLTLDNPGEESKTIKQIIKKNNDSTVVINIQQEGNGVYGKKGEYYLIGNATGIVWTADGYIITNAHCVADTESGSNKPYDRIDVKFYNGEIYEGARIVGFDTETDLAVLKVDKADLVAAGFGDSSKLEVGDLAIAIGNASGLEWTATRGIISGLDRDIFDEGYAIGTLQTDAAINPGNSGGPLINEHGQVIGINSAKLMDTDNVGFAIPINSAKLVLQDLVTYGYPKGRVKLGISGANHADGGFEIKAIDGASSFVGKNIRVGDVIVSVNDAPVFDLNQLRRAMSKHKAGETVSIGVLRGEERFEVDIVLQEDTPK